MAGIEREVGKTIDILKCVLTVAKAVVIAYYRNVWQPRLLHDVTAPYEFFGKPEVALVASMYYKIDVAALPYMSDSVIKLVIAALRIGDKRKAYHVFRTAPLLYLRYVHSMQAGLAADVGTIGVVLKHVARHEK